MKDATDFDVLTVRVRLFQSTRPVKDATCVTARLGDGTQVSIHASREGRDLITWESNNGGIEFQSTRPVKDATLRTIQLTIAAEFQSTRPVKDATRLTYWLVRTLILFQSTRPVKDATVTSTIGDGSCGSFNPRVP